MKEANVKAAVKKYLSAIGAYWFMPVQSGFGTVSIDFLVCHNGKFYGIETKRPGVTKVTPLQDCVMRDIVEAGGGVCMENSIGCEAVKALIGAST